MLGVLFCAPLELDFNGTSKRPGKMQHRFPGVIGCDFGQFIWDPERAPEGPVAIIVSIPSQR
jgi:hypothetical protein